MSGQPALVVLSHILYFWREIAFTSDHTDAGVTIQLVTGTEVNGSSLAEWEDRIDRPNCSAVTPPS